VNALVSSLIVQNHALVARSRITSHHDQLVQRPRLMSTPPFPSGLRVERGEAAAVFGATRELNLSRQFKAFPVWPDHIGTRFEHPLPNCLCHSPLLNGRAARPLLARHWRRRLAPITLHSPPPIAPPWPFTCAAESLLSIGSERRSVRGGSWAAHAINFGLCEILLPPLALAAPPHVQPHTWRHAAVISQLRMCPNTTIASLTI
jgi:hypothetical protein